MMEYFVLYNYARDHIDKSHCVTMDVTALIIRNCQTLENTIPITIIENLFIMLILIYINIYYRKFTIIYNTIYLIKNGAKMLI